MASPWPSAASASIQVVAWAPRGAVPVALASAARAALDGALNGRARRARVSPSTSEAGASTSPPSLSEVQIRPKRSTAGKVTLQMVWAGAPDGWAGMYVHPAVRLA